MGDWGEMGMCIWVSPEDRQEENTFILSLKMANTWLPEHVSIVVITSVFPFNLSANSVW